MRGGAGVSRAGLLLAFAGFCGLLVCDEDDEDDDARGGFAVN